MYLRKKKITQTQRCFVLETIVALQDKFRFNSSFFLLCLNANATGSQLLSSADKGVSHSKLVSVAGTTFSQS
jgi:hypothetical protein